MKTIKGGFFITFEGGEGCGKTTVAKNIEQWLKDKGYKVFYTREPGGIPVAEQIRDLVVNNFTALGPVPQLMLYSASRYLNTMQNIKPQMRDGAIVICDRYYLSSLVYQGAVGGVHIADVKNITKLATDGLVPDINFTLNVSAEVGLRRAAERGGEVNEIDTLSIKFHDQINKAYQYYTDPTNGYLINAELPIEDVIATVQHNIIKELKSIEYRIKEE